MFLQLKHACIGLTIAGSFALSSCSTARSGNSEQRTYDLVLSHGRVMDPESGLDAIRDVGIQGDQIAVISERPLQARERIDVTGLVVAPGFIDLHAHGQDERSARLQAQDGVTTALDMEGGVYPAAVWYASRERKAPINFGASAGHLAARIKVKHGIDVGHRPTDHEHPELVTTVKGWEYDKASPAEIDQLVAYLDQALADGALGIGVQPAYAPGSGRDEIFRVFQLAARRGATVFVHVRSTGETEPASSLAAMQEVFADAATSGAALHIVHVTSSGLRQTPIILEMIEGARKRGLDISVEAYPYTAGATRLASAIFDEGWQQQLGISYGDLQWAATGERLTKETFQKYRRQPGWVIVHMIPEEIADLAIDHPLVMIASDGIPFDTGGEHPRGAGTFSRVLGHYVRERGRLSLMDGLRKMTLMPAQRLERFAPEMEKKGRLRPGTNADVTVFDPATIIDRATYDKPMQPSAGIVHVLVNGTFIVKGSRYVEGVFPGRAVRRHPTPSS
jgi:dihydroorotase